MSPPTSATNARFLSSSPSGVFHVEHLPPPPPVKTYVADTSYFGTAHATDENPKPGPLRAGDEIQLDADHVLVRAGIVKPKEAAPAAPDAPAPAAPDASASAAASTSSKSKKPKAD